MSSTLQVSLNAPTLNAPHVYKSPPAHISHRFVFSIDLCCFLLSKSQKALPGGQQYPSSRCIYSRSRAPSSTSVATSIPGTSLTNPTCRQVQATNSAMAWQKFSESNCNIATQPAKKTSHEANPSSPHPQPTLLSNRSLRLANGSARLSPVPVPC